MNAAGRKVATSRARTGAPTGASGTGRPDAGKESTAELGSLLVRLFAAVFAVVFIVMAVTGTFSVGWVAIVLGAAAAASVTVFIAIQVTGRVSAAGSMAFFTGLMVTLALMAQTVQPYNLGSLMGFVYIGIAVCVTAVEPLRRAVAFSALALLLGVIAIASRSAIPVGAAAVLVGTLALSVFVIARFRFIVQQTRDEAVSQALEDPLTGLANRRGMAVSVPLLAALADRTDQLLGCLALDLDHFKEINDSFGHARGDAVLQQAAELVTANSRRGDVLVRLGGEEFAIFTIVPNAAALAIAGERIRHSVETSDTVPITTSVGGAVVVPGSGDEIDALLQRADEALYAAKQAGRNRVVMARGPE